MKLYGQNQSRSYTFTTAGAVALGCNIHDSMNGFIKVVDTPFAGKSTAAGVAAIHAIPAGNATVTVWHPLLRGKDNEITMPIPIGASGTASKNVSLMIRSAQ